METGQLQIIGILGHHMDSGALSKKDDPPILLQSVHDHHPVDGQ